METDARPTISPYAGPQASLYFGKSSDPLRLPINALTPYRGLTCRARNPGAGPFGKPSCDAFDLTDIPSGAGHVIVHFLMTGTYQCLRSTRDTPEGRCEEEFTTAVGVYAAAMERNLPVLRDLTRQQLAKLGQQLDLLTVISVIGDRGETSPSALGTLHPGTVGYLEFRIQSFAKSATEAEAKDMLDKLKTPTTLSNIMLRNLFLMKLSTKPKLEEKVDRQTDDPFPAKNSVKLAEKAILEAEDAHQRADQEPDCRGRDESPEEEPKETIEDSLDFRELLDMGATDEELSQFKRRRMT